jgi:hypothetical protein
MAVTDWKATTLGANVSRDSSVATWTTPTYIYTSDDSYANSLPKNGYTDWLRATTFGFTSGDIPNGSTIDGIEVKIEKHTAGTPGRLIDSALYLRKTGTQVGNNKASGDNWAATDTDVIYGGADDNWDAGLAQTDIVSEDFGVDFSFLNTTGTAERGYVDVISVRVYYTESGGGTAALTGTATDSITEADIVTGGKTIILTLTDDTWVADDGTFAAQRQNIIDGMDSAQSEATGWDAEVKAKEVVTAVVRTSDTVVTITLTASPDYDITSNETITVTIPATALVGAAPIVADPTFTVAYIPVGGLSIPIALYHYRMMANN